MIEHVGSKVIISGVNILVSWAILSTFSLLEFLFILFTLQNPIYMYMCWAVLGRFFAKTIFSQSCLFMGFAGFPLFCACVFSEMCAIIMNILVRPGRAHTRMGVVYIRFSRGHASLVYIFSWFSSMYRLYIFTLVYFSLACGVLLNSKDFNTYFSSPEV